MRALIDADIICYEFGNMKDLETGELLPWEIVRSFVDERISIILEAVEATEHSLYLTDSKSNFRNQVATIQPYKGHRPTDKPAYWADIRQHLIDNYHAEVCYGIEADDRCGIEQYTEYKKSKEKFDIILDISSDGRERDYSLYKGDSQTVICSRDKDLHMIEGWHYSWQCGNQKERKWFVSEEDGIRFFYKQLLTGDATDNILGLYRIGNKASCVKALDNVVDEVEMLSLVFKEYQNRFGEYAQSFLFENAKLLWIHKEEDDCIEKRLENKGIPRRSQGFSQELLCRNQIGNLLHIMKTGGNITEEEYNSIRRIVCHDFKEQSEKPCDDTSVQDENREGENKV